MTYEEMDGCLVGLIALVENLLEEERASAQRLAAGVWEQQARRLRSCRHAFKLHRIDGLTITQVGELLGVSTTYARLLVSVAETYARRAGGLAVPDPASPGAQGVELARYPLPCRTLNALDGAEVRTVGQLRAWVARDGWSVLLRLRNVGRVSVAALKGCLRFPEVSGVTPTTGQRRPPPHLEEG